MLWNEHQQQIRRKFEHLGRLVAERIESRNPSFDKDGWEQVTEAGLWRLGISPDIGGVGHSWWEVAAALEGLAAGSHDFGFLLSVMAQLGTIHVVSVYGTDTQKANLLPKLFTGAVAATAATEPHGGSDVARVRTAAHDDGKSLLLSGHKSPITNAPIAQIFVIVGRIPALGAKKDISVFVLDRETDVGIETRIGAPTIGARTSPIGDILLSDVAITNENILGQPGAGFLLVQDLLSLDRLMFSIVAAAFGEHILQRSMKFSLDRRSFGRPLADHQHVQEKIVKMKANMEIARSLAHVAMIQRLGDGGEASLLCSLAKMVATDGLYESAQELVQLHGHAGYIEGPISRALTDAVATRIAGGTNEMQKVNIFNHLRRDYSAELHP